mmetsp:Transcript_6850/g.19944  ORF Transcript_6850/g.19944 Transcript_6850/m.19944 type:complete len:231 (-) Transcript_6850:145-837(-)
MLPAGAVVDAHDGALVALKQAHHRSARGDGHVPAPHGVVRGAGREQLAVGGERQRRHGLLVAAEHADGPLGGLALGAHVPDADAEVRAGGGEEHAVRREGHGVLLRVGLDRLRVALELPHAPARIDLRRPARVLRPPRRGEEPQVHEVPRALIRLILLVLLGLLIERILAEPLPAQEAIRRAEVAPRLLEAEEQRLPRVGVRAELLRGGPLVPQRRRRARLAVRDAHRAS